MLTSFRDFLNQLEEEGELLRIRDRVSSKFEASAIIKKLEGKKAVFFEDVDGLSIPVVAGLCTSEEKLCKALNIKTDSLYETILQALNSPKKPQIVENGEVKEIIEKPNLKKVPILTHYEKDGGPYITSAIVSTRSPDGKIENVSVHRLKVLDENHLVIRLVPRQLYTLYQTAKKEGKRSLDVAISVGVHPAVLLAAASPAPFDVNEFDVANALLKGELKLTKCENIDVNVPANSEIVFEGRILLDKEAPEGPFVDVTGTYDIVRLQPVVELVGVMRRKNHVYQALLPAGLEHKLFMGLARKVKIWETVRKVVPTVRSVKLTEGSGGWLHALISIRKETENDGKNVISAAFSAHPSLKHVFVVDEDIDVDNLIEVEWALATRFQGDEDLVILKNVKGSTLDPSANQETGLTTKVGFDLTRPLSKPPEKFKKAVIPENSNVKRILNQILNTKDGTLKLE